MIVLDTNILVAGLWSRTGASFALITNALDGRLDFAISVALAFEYEAVLKRDVMREASWADDKMLETLLDGLFAQAKLVMPIRTKLRPTLRDPDDEMILECAVQSGAESIVTMNVRDFVPAKKQYGIEIETPSECLVRLFYGEKS